MSLRVENLTLQRGSRLLQSGLSFELNPGEALWVQGPNGVGKSTLLETLCGFRPALSGGIFWNSQYIADDLDSYHEAVGYIGHRNGNNENLTAEAALRFYDRVYNSDRLNQSIKLMGLDGRRDIQVRYLSAGQQKRLALARLLLRSLSLWILDEPSVSLDAQGVDLLAKQIKLHQERGGIVFFTSHVPLEIKATKLELMPISMQSLKRQDEFLSSDWEGVL